MFYNVLSATSASSRENTLFNGIQRIAAETIDDPELDQSPAAMLSKLTNALQQFGTVPVTISGETRPLDIAATLFADGSKLTVSIVNPTWDEVKVPLTLLNGSVAGEAELWQVTAPDDMATNEPGRPENVRITGPASVPSARELTVGPASINIFVFSLKN